MPDIEIRRVAGEELLDYKWIFDYALDASPPIGPPDAEEKEDLLPFFEDTLSLMLFEDDEAMAAVFASTMTQHVRGRLVPVGAVWDVATMPEGRRKGHVKKLMSRLFEILREEGQYYSVLYPFKESFYERLGYVTFPQSRVVHFEPDALGSLLEKENLAEGTERQTLSDGYETYREYMNRVQKRQPGLALRNDTSAQKKLEWQEKWLVVAKKRGVVEGAMTYTITKKDIMKVDTFFYDNSLAKYRLLEWIARHTDQVSTVSITLPPDELPELWWSDLELTPKAGSTPMGRVLDVRQLDGLRVGGGSFTASITDEQCEWNTGTYHFDGLSGKLQIERVETESGFEMSINGLTALVFSGHEPEDFQFRGWGDPSLRDLATLRTMFSRELPYLHEMF